MNTENIKSQMRKGILEYCTLLILSKKRAYVSDIIQSLKESRLIVVEGTLYPLLTRLKNAGLLDYEWEESPQGPPRKYDCDYPLLWYRIIAEDLQARRPEHLKYTYNILIYNSMIMPNRSEQNTIKKTIYANLVHLKSV